MSLTLEIKGKRVSLQEKIGEELDNQFALRTERDNLQGKRPRRYFELSLQIEKSAKKVTRLHSIGDKSIATGQKEKAA